MTDLKPFIPRASILGAYFACDFRAGLDRARAEGKLVLDIVDEPSARADFGTCVHFALQTMMKCAWEDDQELHRPDEAQIINARNMHADLPTAVNSCAMLAQGAMPKLPEGVYWQAEYAFEAKALTGHIDFLSSDGEVILDLKTTARKPDHNRIKPGHLYQLIAYYLLVTNKTGKAPSMGYVLYADSERHNWTLLLPFDFRSPAAQELIETVVEYVRYLTGPDLAQRAVPRMGNTCAGDYCPYTSICRDKYIPPSGTPALRVPVDNAPPRTSDMFGAP